MSARASVVLARRARRRTRTIASASTASSSSPKRVLFELVDRSRRGVRAGDAEKGDVERAVDALAASTSKTSENNAAAHGRWRLRYTTEKETLFLLKLKESTTEAFQTLDVKGKTLKNEVVFNDGDAVFTVDAKIEAVSDTRMDFSFTGASLAFRGGLTIPIPPFGSGWFENVYVDDTTRVSRDSRGDTLVCDRVS